MKILPILMALLLLGCTGIPEGITAVDGFDVNRYLGTWYEIARLENRFETGLERISATYALRGDGAVDVLNKGWDVADGEWREAHGKAYFSGPTDEGRLEVSFFGPFYGAYNIIELDKNAYAYSMVAGPDRSYLWILSRSKQLPEATLHALIGKAKALGFDVDRLIFVNHDLNAAH
ncbi:MAG: lipocalin family protein [Methylobacter sp.]